MWLACNIKCSVLPGRRSRKHLDTLVSLGSCADERGDTKDVLHTCGLTGTSVAEENRFNSSWPVTEKKFCPGKKILESLTLCLTGEPWGHLGDCSSWMCDFPLWLEESHGERQERRGHLPEEKDNFAAGFLAAHRQHGWQWHLYFPQRSTEKLWQRGDLPGRLVFLWAPLHVRWVLNFGSLCLSIWEVGGTCTFLCLGSWEMNKPKIPGSYCDKGLRSQGEVTKSF